MDTTHWIDGGSAVSSEDQWAEITSPVDGDRLGRVALGTALDVDRAVESAHAAFQSWKLRSPVDRSRTLLVVAGALRDEFKRLLDIECRETGKSAALATNELTMSIDYFDFYAGLLRGFTGSTIDVGPTLHISTRHQPYGVVAAIATWNAPLAMVTRNVAPALAAGNAVVAKPSEFTPSSTVELARIATAAGLPAGLLNVVTGTVSPAGMALVDHELVRKIHFTGSVGAGRKIGESAARRVVPVTLELGGKSPNIIFADANLERASEFAVATFTMNAGQVCSAGTRLIVEEAVHDEMVDRMVQRIGHMDVESDVGPIMTAPQLEKVGDYLALAEAEGLVPRTGGRADFDRRAEGVRPRYVTPTMYDRVSNDSRLAREEIFGPVLTVMTFGDEDEDEAVELANQSEFGLVAGIWTRNLARAHRIAARIEAGQVFVNHWGSPVEAPFGGFKSSGIGREKGPDALREYSQEQSIVISLAD
jgi:aldehyde dehydrogenase (NAD+)